MITNILQQIVRNYFWVMVNLEFVRILNIYWSINGYQEKIPVNSSNSAILICARPPSYFVGWINLKIHWEMT